MKKLLRKTKLLRNFDIVYNSCKEEIIIAKYLKSIGENVYNYDEIIKQNINAENAWNCFKFYSKNGTVYSVSEWGRGHCVFEYSDYEVKKEKITYQTLVRQQRKDKLKKLYESTWKF